MNVKEPHTLWKILKDRFYHQKAVIFPNTCEEWRELCLQDFAKVSDYNSVIFRIVSQLKFCGEKITNKDMLEKTYSTFHPSNRR